MEAFLSAIGAIFPQRQETGERDHSYNSDDV